MDSLTTCCNCPRLIIDSVGDTFAKLSDVGQAGTQDARIAKAVIRQFSRHATTPAVEKLVLRLREAIAAHDPNEAFDTAIDAELAGLTHAVREAGQNAAPSVCEVK